MSKTETLKQSAVAANVQDLTERARAQVQEAQTLLEQVKARSMEQPLTAEELARQIEPLLSTLVAVAQLDMTTLERASAATVKAAEATASLSSGLKEASQRARYASETWRETLFQQVGWQIVLSVITGGVLAAAVLGLLNWAGGLKQPSIYLDCQRVQRELDKRQTPAWLHQPQPQQR